LILYHTTVFVLTNDEYDKSKIPDDMFDIIISDTSDTSHKKFAIDQIRLNNLCKGLYPEYIEEEALTYASFFVYLYNEAPGVAPPPPMGGAGGAVVAPAASRTLQGIVIVQDVYNDAFQEPSFHIDVICGSNDYYGVGSKLIDKIIKIAEITGKKKLHFLQ
jgi:hypothetical protein